MVMVNDIKHQCAMDADCQGVTCEVESTPDMKTETVSVSARIDSCNSKVIIVLDNEKWEKSLTSAVSGMQFFFFFFNCFYCFMKTYVKE